MRPIILAIAVWTGLSAAFAMPEVLDKKGFDCIAYCQAENPNLNNNCCTCWCNAGVSLLFRDLKSLHFLLISPRPNALLVIQGTVTAGDAVINAATAAQPPSTAIRAVAVGQKMHH